MFCLWALACYVCISDVKRGQKLEAEIEALKPRPRPGPWGQGRGRGLFLEVEAKEKVMNKIYQTMMTTYGWIYRPIIMIIMTHLISHSFTQYLSSVVLPFPGLQQKNQQLSLLGCWFFCCKPRPGRSQMFKAKADAEAKALRPRLRPNFWPRSHFGLEDLVCKLYIHDLCAWNQIFMLLITQEKQWH